MTGKMFILYFVHYLFSLENTLFNKSLFSNYILYNIASLLDVTQTMTQVFQKPNQHGMFVNNRRGYLYLFALLACSTVREHCFQDALLVLFLPLSLFLEIFRRHSVLSRYIFLSMRDALLRQTSKWYVKKQLKPVFALKYVLKDEVSRLGETNIQTSCY